MNRKPKKQFRGRAGIEAFQKRIDKETRNALRLPAKGMIPPELREAYRTEYRRQIARDREKKLARKRALSKAGQTGGKPEETPGKGSSSGCGQG